MKKRRKNLVGQNIRKQRMKRNFTQEALALSTGLSQGYVNQLESGKKWGSLDTVQKIADFLDIPIAVLFEEEKEDKKNTLVKGPKEKIYQKEKLNKAELWKLFNRLPEHIADHYMLLMEMEIDILELPQPDPGINPAITDIRQYQTNNIKK